MQSPGVAAIDPLRIVIDTRAGGISGYHARHLLAQVDRIHVELSTEAVIVAIIGPGDVDDLDRFVPALHRLPRDERRHPSSSGTAGSLAQPR